MISISDLTNLFRSILRGRVQGSLLKRPTFSCLQDALDFKGFSITFGMFLVDFVHRLFGTDLLVDGQGDLVFLADFGRFWWSYDRSLRFVWGFFHTFGSDFGEVMAAIYDLYGVFLTLLGGVFESILRCQCHFGRVWGQFWVTLLAGSNGNWVSFWGLILGLAVRFGSVFEPILE